MNAAYFETMHGNLHHFLPYCMASSFNKSRRSNRCERHYSVKACLRGQLTASFLNRHSVKCDIAQKHSLARMMHLLPVNEVKILGYKSKILNLPYTTLRIHLKLKF